MDRRFVLCCLDDVGLCSCFDIKVRYDAMAQRSFNVERHSVTSILKSR